MPLYEYQCDACERRFERIQKFSDPPIETCPTCGGHVHKLVSSPAFQFKGTGWYVTDYSRKEKGASTGEGEPGAKDSKDSKESKESKEGGESKGSDTKGPKEAKDSKPSSEPTGPKDSPSTSSDSTPAKPSKS